MKDTEIKSESKKRSYKKYWFLIIAAAIFIAGIGSCGTGSGIKNNQGGTIHFQVYDVPNDVTGNWRISTIAENIEMQDCALDYYKKYFKSDDEIHAIVNFNYNTTTKISVSGNMINVSVYEYVKKEEHDARLLFGGMLLKEYCVSKDTGEIQ